MVGEQVNWSGGQARAYAWQVRVRCRVSCIMNVTDHRRWDKQRDIIKVLRLRLPEMPRHSSRLAVGLDGTRNRPSAWTSTFVPSFVVACGPARSLGRFCPFLHMATLRRFGERQKCAPSEWSLRAFGVCVTSFPCRQCQRLLAPPVSLRWERRRDFNSEETSFGFVQSGSTAVLKTIDGFSEA